MNKNPVDMWSNDSLDMKNLNFVVGLQEPKIKPEYQPTPYTFTMLENGKKNAMDPSSFSPPSWLLLDHTIAVIWSMFSLSSSQLLTVDDLKWAHEFLKEIRNKKGEYPADVKVCLKEIQDRLINLYARLTSMKEEDFDEIAAAFGEKIIEDTAENYVNAYELTKVDSKTDTISCSSLTPSRTTIRLPYSKFVESSGKDPIMSKTSENTTHQTIAMNYSKKTFPALDKESNIFEEPEILEDEEVEKYVLSLFDDEKKDESQKKTPGRSLIPTKRKTPTTLAFTEMVSTQDATSETPKKDKISKKVHCVAEMRSLKFQKSTKVQDTNGEEAAYSNLKAEIRRLTFNPNVSKNEIMKFLKEWRSEQVDRLSNELKRLNSIEEFMKSVGNEECEPNLRKIKN